MKPGDGPIVLVLAPTRELAVQIKEECDKFGASSEIKNTVVYGGVPKSRQVRDLRNGIEIVIATPVRSWAKEIEFPRTTSDPVHSSLTGSFD